MKFFLCTTKAQLFLATPSVASHQGLLHSFAPVDLLAQQNGLHTKPAGSRAGRVHKISWESPEILEIIDHHYSYCIP